MIDCNLPFDTGVAMLIAMAFGCFVGIILGAMARR